jgi:hypothetical protein
LRLTKRKIMRTNHNHKPANNNIAWALVSLCQRKNLPIDQERLRQQFPFLHDLTGFRIAACALGLTVVFKRVAAQELHELPLPIVAFRRTTDEAVEQAAGIATTPPPAVAESEVVVPTTRAPLSRLSPCLIVRANKDRIVYCEPGSQTPTITSVAEFANRFMHQIIFAIPEAKRAAFSSDRFLFETKQLALPNIPDAQSMSNLRPEPALVKPNQIPRHGLLTSLVVLLATLAILLSALVAAVGMMDHSR